MHYAADELRSSYIDLINSYRWDWFGTLTIKENVAPAKADKFFQILIARINRAIFGRHYKRFNEGVWWLRVEEPHHSGEMHYHALIGGVENASPYEFRDWCVSRIGRAEITQFDPEKAAAHYLTKGLLNDGSNITCDLDNAQTQSAADADLEQQLTDREFEACLVEHEISRLLDTPFDLADEALVRINATANDRQILIDLAIRNVRAEYALLMAQ